MNVEGKKVEKMTHSVEHVINWSHLSLGLGLIAVGWAVVVLFRGDKNQEDGLSNEVREARS
jgi:hypothetical protein